MSSSQQLKSEHRIIAYLHKNMAVAITAAFIRMVLMAIPMTIIYFVVDHEGETQTIPIVIGIVLGLVVFIKTDRPLMQLMAKRCDLIFHDDGLIIEMKGTRTEYEKNEILNLRAYSVPTDTSEVKHIALETELQGAFDIVETWVDAESMSTFESLYRIMPESNSKVQ